MTVVLLTDAACELLEKLLFPKSSEPEPSLTGMVRWTVASSELHRRVAQPRCYWKTLLHPDRRTAHRA